MLKTLKKYYKFSGEYGPVMKNSLLLGILQSVFVALKLPAMWIVLRAYFNGSLDLKICLIAFAVMFLGILGDGFCQTKMTLAYTKAGYLTTAFKRVSIAEHLKVVPMGYFNEKSLGNIASVATNTCAWIQEVATRIILLVGKGLSTTLIIVLLITVYNWKVGLILVAGLIVFMLINTWMQTYSKKFVPGLDRSKTELVSAVLEYLQGVSLVRSYNLDQEANQRVDEAIEEANKAFFKAEKILLPFNFAMPFFLKLFATLFIGASVSLFIDGGLPIADTIVLIVSAFIVFSELETTGNLSGLVRLIDRHIDVINEVEDTPAMDIDGEEIKPDNHDISFDNVDFSYGDRKVIDGVSLDIPEKTFTAIVGPSGGGKTTLCNLIARFWDVDKGSVSIGGRDVREYSLESLMDNISMVFQRVYLFNDTVANNIAFGAEDKSMDKIIEAAKKACCHDFIMGLPDGYQTVIGDGGASLSGGERQRISVARAMMKDAPIIILDEGTANVDPENENLLIEAIEKLTQDKTVIMIAHRLKTIRNADQILVVEGGKITGRGKHEELMAQQGLYHDFIEQRKKSIGWKIA